MALFFACMTIVTAVAVSSSIRQNHRQAYLRGIGARLTSRHQLAVLLADR